MALGQLVDASHTTLLLEMSFSSVGLLITLIIGILGSLGMFSNWKTSALLKLLFFIHIICSTCWYMTKLVMCGLAFHDKTIWAGEVVDSIFMCVQALCLLAVFLVRLWITFSQSTWRMTNCTRNVLVVMYCLLTILF